VATRAKAKAMQDVETNEQTNKRTNEQTNKRTKEASTTYKRKKVKENRRGESLEKKEVFFIYLRKKQKGSSLFLSSRQ
jgi:hypothetical protein